MKFLHALQTTNWSKVAASLLCGASYQESRDCTLHDLKRQHCDQRVPLPSYVRPCNQTFYWIRNRGSEGGGRYQGLIWALFPLVWALYQYSYCTCHLYVLKDSHCCNVLGKRLELKWPCFNIYRKEATIENCAKQTIQIHVKKGDAIIWHPLLPHDGDPTWGSKWQESSDKTRSHFSIVSHARHSTALTYSSIQRRKSRHSPIGIIEWKEQKRVFRITALLGSDSISRQSFVREISTSISLIMCAGSCGKARLILLSDNYSKNRVYYAHMQLCIRHRFHNSR